MHIVSLVKVAVSVFSTLVKYTVTEIDDRIVSFLEAALQNPAVLDLLESILNDHDVATHKDEARNAAIYASVGRFDGSRLDKIKDVLNSLGITWETFTTYLPLVIRLLLSISGKR